MLLEAKPSWSTARVPAPLVRDTGPKWAKEAGTSAQRSDGVRIPAASYQALLHFLAAVHGFACLEGFDHLNWISEKSRDELFDAQIELLILAMGASNDRADVPSARSRPGRVVS